LGHGARLIFRLRGRTIEMLRQLSLMIHLQQAMIWLWARFKRRRALQWELTLGRRCFWVTYTDLAIDKKVFKAKKMSVFSHVGG